MAFAQLVSLLWTSVAFDNSVVKHTAPVNLKSNKNGASGSNLLKRLEAAEFEFNKHSLVALLDRLKKYTKLEIPLFLLFIFRCCPVARYLSPKTRNKFKLLKKGSAKFDVALDIRSLFRVRQEIHSLKHTLFSKQ